MSMLSWHEFFETSSPFYSTPTFRRMWAPLTERERKILTLRWDGETLDSIAEIYGLGKERVRQIEAVAYNKMRRAAWAMLTDDAPIRSARARSFSRSAKARAAPEE